MEYEFNHCFKCERGTDIAIDQKALYGCWERLGGYEGGGLWFEKINDELHLVDYDGTPELALRVLNALRNEGYIVDAEFYC